MTTAQSARLKERRARPRTAVIDCDVHNELRSRGELKRFLPARWHVYYDHGPHVSGLADLVVGARPHRDIFRRDAMPADGPPGSSLELLREQLLDRHGVEKAIVHPVREVLKAPPYGELGGAVARAINEWMESEWLAEDARIFGAISVPVEDPERGAREIARAAQNSRFVKVMLPVLLREALGHPRYWPIYEVASDRGLPIAVHVGGFSGTHFATGWPTYFVEHHSSFTQAYVAHVVSLVSSGVFDRFPKLRFVFEEGGIGWVPSLMWRLDHSWETMREHVPHLVEPPSSLIRRHMAFTTQPLDEPEQARFLVQIMEQLDMSDRLMFASDYPHWDFDAPDRVLPETLVGSELRTKILSDNALAFFPFP